MRMIPGGCHCGAIRYEFSWPLSGPEIPVRACTCDFCSRHRGTYTSHPEAKIDAVLDESLVSPYSFATGTAEFLVCRRCGVMPLATSQIEGRLYAVVNVNTFDHGHGLTLIESESDFDGEEIGERLARRSRTWIPEVSVRHRDCRSG